MRAVSSFAAPWRRVLLAVLLTGWLTTLQDGSAARQSCGSQPLIRIGGTGSAGGTFSPSISGNGRYVAFESMASEFEGNASMDVYVYDRVTCAIELISVSSTGVKGNQASGDPSISDDGRYVAFLSRAANLVPSDVNSFTQDAFLRDRLLGQTTLISIDSAEVQPAVESATQVRISGNGQFVGFVSSATTLVLDDTNSESDVFVRDLAAGTTERISVASGGVQGESPNNNGVGGAVLSEDGRFVAFGSQMNNLVPNDTNSGQDIFVRDRVLNTTVRASLQADGSQVTFGGLSGYALTADGRFVVFGAGSNLVPGNESCDGIFIRDLDLSTTTCAEMDPANLSFGQNARGPAISKDGRYVAFVSSASHHVPGDTNIATDVFVHDRAIGMTRRASISLSGNQVESSGSTSISLSGDGQVVAFDSFEDYLVPPDPNGETTDLFVARWTELGSAAEVNLTLNGSFANGLQLWQAFATPDASYVVTDTSAGELQFYRVPPPPGTANQAVVFQQTTAPLLAHTPIEARFRLGNSSSVRKRISVLIHDADFSDLFVCAFWLQPNAPMRSYVMRTHTTSFWSNATISFYAATAGSDGGFYRIDDVSLFYQPILDDDVTDCLDPTAPVAPGGAAGPSLLTNGDFAGGLAPWATFGQIISQITNAVFEFVRPPGTPAGVLLQPTGTPLAQHDILTATFYLGNSSSVRKRVTVILHDQDFSDLSACTFWLAPGQLLSPYVMRTFATKPWANATFSLYPATVGLDEWLRFTDATMQVTPGTTPLGTECLEPGAGSIALANRGLQAYADRARAPRPLKQPGALGTFASEDAVLTAPAVASGSRVIWQRLFDLGAVSNPLLSFESSFDGTNSRGLAQLSLDGVSWITIADVSTSADWTTVDLDLSAFAGGIVHVRLVFDDSVTDSGSAPARWRVRRVRLDRRE